nr:reductive dehalogenase [uncultured bacterium]
MSNKEISRKQFLKGAAVTSGAAAAALAASSLSVSADSGTSVDYTKGKARDEMGTASVTRNLPEHFYKRIEPRAGYIGTTKVNGALEQFDAREHGFAQIVRRASSGDWEGEPGDWGPMLLAAVQEKKKVRAAASAEETEDYTWSGAFQIAMDRWHVNLRPGQWDPAPINSNKLELSPAEMTAKIKKVARWFGAEQVGICEITDDLKPYFYKKGRASGYYTAPHPDYADEGRDIPWPYPYKYCIVMGDIADPNTARAQRGPLVEASAKIACADSDFPPLYLESIIRTLGYDAKGSPFSDKDIIEAPIAVAAGIGELGRSGLVISPWGAHMRLSEVFTNMPLVPDKPMDFGLQDFCKACKKCADNCPAGAIDGSDEPSEQHVTAKVVKWAWDEKKCLSRRLAYGCSSCQTVCPWTKPDNMVHEIGRMLAKEKAFAPFLYKLDDFFYGREPAMHTSDEYAPWR